MPAGIVAHGNPPSDTQSRPGTATSQGDGSDAPKPQIPEVTHSLSGTTEAEGIEESRNSEDTAAEAADTSAEVET